MTAFVTPFRQSAIVKAFAWVALLGVALGCGAVRADEPVVQARAKVKALEVKADGKWHGNAAASLSYASGNTRNASLAFSIDAARRSGEHSKLALYAQALGSRAESTANGVTTTSTTANQWMGGARYDHDFTDTTLGFAALDLTHDRIQLLSLRSVTSVGAGYHLIHTDDNKWDLLGGVSYRDDRYNDPGVVIGSQLRTRFNTGQLLVGEESNSKLTPTTTLKQRLIVTPNLNRDHGALVTFDGSLVVAINDKLSLKITVQDRYNSLSQPPIMKNAFLLLTGLNVKFDG